MADLNALAELIRKGKEDKLKREVQEQERKRPNLLLFLVNYLVLYLKRK